MPTLVADLHDRALPANRAAGAGAQQRGERLEDADLRADLVVAIRRRALRAISKRAGRSMAARRRGRPAGAGIPSGPQHGRVPGGNSQCGHA
jgi:hypothetical protein